MTFEEAFNSGLRFKLPKGYTDGSFLGEVSWPDGWWWIKHSKDEIFVIGLNEAFSINTIFTNPPSYLDESQKEDWLRVNNIYKNSTDWFLDPIQEFKNKVELILSE